MRYSNHEVITTDTSYSLKIALLHPYLPIMATSLQRPLSSVLEEEAVGEGSTVTSKFLVYRF